MHVSHGRMPGAESAIQKDTFTGQVWADPVFTGSDLAVIYHVFFTPRARTFWHSHPGGQVLHVSHGNGFVVTQEGDQSAIRPGDVVWSDPGEVHWHGADEHSYLLHTAVSIGGTDWLHEVTDEEYEEALRRHRSATGITGH